MKENFYCRVCGLKYDDPPWGKDGFTPTYEICNCCGVEFGYQDSILAGIHSYREDWIEKGAKWKYPRFKPLNWDLEKQLNNVPLQFR